MLVVPQQCATEKESFMQANTLDSNPLKRSNMSGEAISSAPPVIMNTLSLASDSALAYSHWYGVTAATHFAVASGSMKEAIMKFSIPIR